MIARSTWWRTLTICLSLCLGTSGIRADESDNAQDSDQAATKKIVPIFTFDRSLLESPVGDDPLFGTVGAETLKDLVARLEQACDDDEVAAVVVMLSDPGMGRGQLEEVRQSLYRIRKSGKPVYAHATSLSFGGLALLSAADRISVEPVGELFITGLYGEQPHLRGLLDRLKVYPEFLTCGDYKSAGEMYTHEQPSPEAKQMYDWLYDSIFDSYVNMIAEGRGQSAETVRGWIDQGLYSSAKAAELGIIDAVEDRKQFGDWIRETLVDEVEFERRYGKGSRKSVDLSNPFAVFKVWGDLLQGKSKTEADEKSTVAIVYVEGAIMPGRGGGGTLALQQVAYSDPIRKALNQVADDETVKAVVLRINSPGGSAVASEMILAATKQVAAEKPLIVSMGDVAASGGYYVACGASTIMADAVTLTGSIGVVSGKLATREMWDQIGVNWHPIARGKNSGLLGSGDSFTDEQRKMLQAWMDEVYEVFKGHVAKIREGKLTKPIDEIAGGRVYTGRQALELGLVDRIGTLHDAIKLAAEQAGVEDYDVRVVPRAKSVIEMMLADVADDADDEIDLYDGRSWQDRLQTEAVWQATQQMLPTLSPARAAALRRMLVQLEVLQREGLTLSAPEILIAP